jgi:hypothetical protein
MREAEKTATEAAGAEFIDTREWFGIGDKCTSYVLDLAAYIDAFHLSRSYSKHLVPVPKDALTAALGQGTPSG